MTSKDRPSMAGPAIGVTTAASASAPAVTEECEQEGGNSRKRSRGDAEGEVLDDWTVYVERLRQRVEDFLLSLVIEVVQASHNRRRVSEQEAADMIKCIVKALIEAD